MLKSECIAACQSKTLVGMLQLISSDKINVNTYTRMHIRMYTNTHTCTHTQTHTHTHTYRHTHLSIHSCIDQPTVFAKIS